MKILPILLIAGGAVSFGQSPVIGTCPVLPANNIWNTPVNMLPIAGTSATYVATIGAAKPLHPDFGPEADAGIPFITVSGTQTKYPATFEFDNESDAGPYAVPLNAPIEGGPNGQGDRHAIAIDTTNCKLYELYSANPQAASWVAGSGAIYDLNSNALRPYGWTSADAAGLPIFPGLVRYDEILTGEIRHAIRFTVPKTQRAFVWPARHRASIITDGAYPPMGTRFRLRADFDISNYSATNQIILKALKKYGMILADNGSSWFISGAPDPHWDNDELHKLTLVHGSDFEQVDVAPLMIDINSGQAAQADAPPLPVTVSVTPGSSTVKTGQTAQFAAQVQNANGQAVTWKINGIAGGDASVGFISATGFYTAPALVPAAGSVSVQAVVGSVTGAANVTIQQTIVITLSPALTYTAPGKSVKFTAATNAPLNGGVTWKVNGIVGGNAAVGTIGAAGLYVAPAQLAATTTFQISATGTTDATVNANASVVVQVVTRR